MTTPNFRKGTGRLATDRYDFEAHLEGRNPDAGSAYVHSFRHLASQVDVDNPSLVYGSPPDVETALENIKDFIDIFSSIGQGFVTIGDGYNAWHAADGNINLDPTVESIDGIMNAISNYLYAGVGNLTAYDRIKFGGILLVKSGTYLVKDTINIPPGLIILGEGYGTKFINATGVILPTVDTNPISIRTELNIANGDITATSPVQVTCVEVDPVSIATGDKVVISGYTGITITGGSGANGNVFTVTVISPGVFTLDGSTGTGASIGGTVSFTRPMFNVLPQISPDIPRTINDDAVDSENSFIFSKSSKIMNLVISDNFVENTILGDFAHYLPQNVDAVNPLIFQSAGSNLELINVYMMGRVIFGVPPAVDAATAHAIKLDPILGTGTFLKIKDCFIDGFSQPINYLTIGGAEDYLEVCDNKIRAHGYLNGNGTTAINNCIISMNDNNAIINSNYFYSNHSVLTTIVYIDSVLGSAPNLQAKSKIVVASNDLTINRLSNSVLTSTVISLNAGITTDILTRATVLAYGNTFQNTEGFKIESAAGPHFSATTALTTIGSATAAHQLIAQSTGTTIFDSTVARTYLPVAVKHKIVSISADYTVDTGSTDFMIFVDTSSAAVDITLPAHDTGRTLIIKDVGFNASVNNITLIRAGATGDIDNYTGNRIIATNGASWTLISNGTNWYIV